MKNNRLNTLFENKIQFLLEFSLLNNSEMRRLEASDFDNVESFYDKREKLLKIIQRLNAQIDREANRLHAGNLAQEHKLSNSFQARILELAEGIKEQDLYILSLIEQAKSQIIKDLQNLNKNKKTMASYKTKVDHHQFDEKA